MTQDKTASAFPPSFTSAGGNESSEKSRTPNTTPRIHHRMRRIRPSVSLVNPRGPPFSFVLQWGDLEPYYDCWIVMRSFPLSWKRGCAPADQLGARLVSISLLVSQGWGGGEKKAEGEGWGQERVSAGLVPAKRFCHTYHPGASR